MKTAFRREGIEIDLVLASFKPDHPDSPYGGKSYWQAKSGDVLEAALRLNLDMPHSIMIGDSPRDIEAAKASHSGFKRCAFADPSIARRNQQSFGRIKNQWDASLRWHD